MTRRPRIALDAMGGDRAPGAAVAAARRATRDHGLDVVLVGDPARLEGAGGTVRVVAAADVVGMAEEAALAVRAKPGASIRVAVRLLAEGLVDAVVSAGSTGATLAAGLLGLGRVSGIRRPAVAAVVPTRDAGRDAATVLLDAGATADVRPEALVAYARMGTAYARVRGVADPRVGLLNVGAEPGKGNELARAAYRLLRDTAGFVGNVEPAAVLGGAADVVVTDGFAGNVFLKTAEALAGSGSGSGSGAPGAAVLLGVRGTLLVAHGDADDDELVAALRTADRVAAGGLAARVAAVMAGAPEPRPGAEGT